MMKYVIYTLFISVVVIIPSFGNGQLFQHSNSFPPQRTTISKKVVQEPENCGRCYNLTNRMSTEAKSVIFIVLLGLFSLVVFFFINKLLVQYGGKIVRDCLLLFGVLSGLFIYLKFVPGVSANVMILEVKNRYSLCECMIGRIHIQETSMIWKLIFKNGILIQAYIITLIGINEYNRNRYKRLHKKVS